VGLLALVMIFTGVWHYADGSRHAGKPAKVKTGLEILLEQPDRLKGKKVGLITNPTAITRDYRHALDAMLDAGIQVVKVYGPEHGTGGRGAGFLRGSPDRTSLYQPLRQTA